MIGHSMGGYVTMAFVDYYRDLLEGYGLFHSSAFADSEEKKAARRKGIEFIRQNGAYEFLRTSAPNLFSPISNDKMKEYIDEFIRGLSNFSPGALVSYYEAMMGRPDRTSLLKNVKLPVLFIMGEFDNAIPLQDALKQCHLPDLSYIHILGHSGHMGMIEEADPSNKTLLKFLEFFR
jgi:pimeloyl-ACP methyl ester carboxylesterase